MCYSAKIKADYRMFVRDFGAIIDLKEFARLYGAREQGSKAKIPKALDAWFADPRSPEEAKIHAMIQAHDAAEMTALEQELFAQKQRLNKAVRAGDEADEEGGRGQADCDRQDRACHYAHSRPAASRRRRAIGASSPGTTRRC